ncbi:MAG: cell envelope integrity EipB family protein [Alphaproteobacteria bacterium]|nr:cell envelope integrity EipB family protein [Alphaproteobacteria bacterium]
MTSSGSFLVGLSCLLILVCPAGAQDLPLKAPEAAAHLAPHKALYEVTLVSTRSGSQVINVAGKMLYEWQPDCEGWLSNHRFDLVYEYADTPAMKVQSDFSTYETFDGRTMDFASTRKNDNALFQELRGHAQIGRNPDKKGGEAVYTLPGDLSFDLPEGGLFPMSHTLGVLDRIKQGHAVYSAVVFDGSDENGPVEINTVIGQPVDALKILGPHLPPEVDTSLLKTPARRLRLAFFPLEDTADTPDYEMGIIFHNNGIISDMLIDYEGFSITQKLIALESLDTACKSPTP